MSAYEFTLPTATVSNDDLAKLGTLLAVSVQTFADRPEVAQFFRKAAEAVAAELTVRKLFEADFGANVKFTADLSGWSQSTVVTLAEFWNDKGWESPYPVSEACFALRDGILAAAGMDADAVEQFYSLLAYAERLAAESANDDI